MLKVRVNPDKEIVKMVTDYLRDHNGECPCQIGQKCQCSKFKQMNSVGQCHCMLFEKYEVKDG